MTVLTAKAAFLTCPIPQSQPCSLASHFCHVKWSNHLRFFLTVSREKQHGFKASLLDTSFRIRWCKLWKTLILSIDPHTPSNNPSVCKNNESHFYTINKAQKLLTDCQKPFRDMSDFKCMNNQANTTDVNRLVTKAKGNKSWKAFLDSQSTAGLRGLQLMPH